jgi:hypothetical protein
LHATATVSTRVLRAAVKTVGKGKRKPPIFSLLPAFHFREDQFSKTWTAIIPAAGVVPDLVSTFPAATVTTARKELIIFFPVVVELRCPRNPQEAQVGILRRLRGGVE